MRKKLWFTVAAVAVVAVAAWFLWSSRLRAFPEKVFPEDTILYAVVPDVREAAKAWRNTAFAGAIRESPRSEVYRRLGDQAAQAADSVLGADLRPVLGEFTRSVSVGILPRAAGKRGLGVVAYVSDPDRLKKYVEQKVETGWLRRDPSLKKETGIHGKFTYYKYSTPALPPSFQPCLALVRHHLFLASTPDTMDRLLDGVDGRGPSLRSDSVFARAKREVSSGQLFLYLNAQSARRSFEPGLPGGAGRLWPDIWRLSGVEALQFAGWSLSVRDDAFEGHGFAGVAEERGGLLGAFLNRPPARLLSVGLVPETAGFFYAATLPDFSQVVREKDSGWSQVLELLRALTRVDMQGQLLEALGTEGAVFSTVRPESAGGIPGTAMAVHVRRPEQFAMALERVSAIAESRGIRRVPESYGDARILRFELPFLNPTFNPAVTIHESWFLAATDMNSLRNVLDADARERSVVRLPDFQAATSSFPDQVNVLSYTRVPVVLHGFSRMLHAEAGAGEEWIRAYGLDAELEYLSGRLAGAAFFLEFEPGGIRFESRSSVPPGFLVLPPLAARLPAWIDPDPDSEGFE